MEHLGPDDLRFTLRLYNYSPFFFLKPCKSHQVHFRVRVQIPPFFFCLGRGQIYPALQKNPAGCVSSPLSSQAGDQLWYQRCEGAHVEAKVVSWQPPRLGVFFVNQFPPRETANCQPHRFSEDDWGWNLSWKQCMLGGILCDTSSRLETFGSKGTNESFWFPNNTSPKQHFPFMVDHLAGFDFDFHLFCDMWEEAEKYSTFGRFGRFGSVKLGCRGSRWSTTPKSLGEVGWTCTDSTGTWWAHWFAAWWIFCWSRCLIFFWEIYVLFWEAFSHRPAGKQLELRCLFSLVWLF